MVRGSDWCMNRNSIENGWLTRQKLNHLLPLSCLTLHCYMSAFISVIFRQVEQYARRGSIQKCRKIEGGASATKATRVVSWWSQSWWCLIRIRACDLKFDRVKWDHGTTATTSASFSLAIYYSASPGPARAPPPPPAFLATAWGIKDTASTR